MNIVIPFNDHVLDVLQASDSSDAALEELYRQVEGYQTGAARTSMWRRHRPWNLRRL